MGGRFILATAFVVVLASCTSSGSDPSTTPSSSATTTSTATTRTSSDSSDPGRLAIVDSTGNIVVVDPDGTSRRQITNGGGTDNPAIYMQPVWSPDGSMLSWGQTTGTGFGVGISRPGSDVITTLTTPSLPFFTYWSPNGRHLGVLHNGTEGVQFQIADVEQETTSVLGEDSPFYFSWSPDGERVVTHAGSSRVETISPEGERTELEPTTGNYLAPQWTDAGVFHVVADRLVLESDGGERRPIASVSGLTLFVSNPQGTLVALLSTGGDGAGITASTEEFPTPPTGSVVVVDVESGETEIVSGSAALGFFWSPDGRSLLALTTAETRIIPVVWSVGGEQREFQPFQPPRSMLQDTFPFFPQYAQSLSFWAPDSSAFAFAGQVEGQGGIWVQDLAEDSPTMVSDGTWVAWSPARP